MELQYNKIPKNGAVEIDKILGYWKDRLILNGYRGSVAHGMYVPNTDPNSIDDIDTMGILIAPKEYYIGLKHIEQVEKFVGQWDIVVYEVQKFVKLLLKNNPNVLSMLWLKPELYTHISPLGHKLLKHRDLFLSQACYQSFCGYAYSQLHRMEHMAFKGYMGEKRKRLVEEHGYDTKNAAHCIRLLRMGSELLKTGEVNVWRKDAAELLDIKRGNWTLTEVKAEAEEQFNKLKSSLIGSPLPIEPDHKKAESLLVELIEESLETDHLSQNLYAAQK